MLFTEYKNKLAMEISGNPEPFFEKLLPGVAVERSGDTIRLQPCPKCGHNDSCNLTQGTPFIHCFSTGCDLKGNIVDALLSLPGVTEGQISSIAAEVYRVDIPDERENKLQRIRDIGIEHYHAQLMSSSKPLRHQIEVRKHKEETLRLFKIGLAMNYPILHRTLIEEGFGMEEIKEAKIWIPEGLFVYPYIDWKTGIIRRINTKGIPDENGVKPDGHSWGDKVFYTTPGISKARVVLVEGEDDLLSLWEAGIDSVIASGGNLSSEQLQKLPDLVDECDKVFNMFDNDEAGAAYDEKVVAAIPHKMVFKAVYEGKDPDDLLKRSEFTGSMEELLQGATLLPSDGYTMQHHSHNWSMLTRRFAIKFIVKGRDSNGLFNGDVEFYIGPVLTDAKVNCKISSYSHKDIPSINVFQFHRELETFYSGHSKDLDLTDLLDCYEFTSKKSNVVKRIAEKISNSEDKEHDIVEISKRLKTSVRDSVLGELNELDNATLSTHDGIPKVKISQFFSIKNGEAYFYFNKVVDDGEGTVRLPYLLSNKREQIRLDLINYKQIMKNYGSYKIKDLQNLTNCIEQGLTFTVRNKMIIPELHPSKRNRNNPNTKELYPMLANRLFKLISNSIDL